MRYASILAAILAVGLLSEAGRTGEPAGEALLPIHADRDAYLPCAVFGKDVFLVVWQSGRLAPGDLREGFNFWGDIVGCRVGRDGKALDPTPFVICKAPDLQDHPQAAFAPSTSSGPGGGMFLVVWQDMRNSRDWDVYAARVSPEGKVLDPDGILISGGAHNQAMPRVAWDGKNFLVAWQDFRSGAHYEVYAARIDSNGKVLDPEGIPITPNRDRDGHCYSPAVASAADGRSCIYWIGRGHGVYGTGFSGGNMVIDGKSKSVFEWKKDAASGERDVHTLTGPVGSMGPLCTAAGNEGKTYLSAWTTQIAERNQGKLNASLYDADGKRTKVISVAGHPTRIADPELCWDGSAFVAVWHQHVRDNDRACPYPATFVSRISAAGEVIGKTERIAGTLATPAMNAAVASSGDGTSLVAYEKHPEKADAPIRIGFRLFRAAP
jgi:hypothetical protein